ncbi:unnamed protein product [Adineta ricciae]|uniref:MULE transposase domain-containing protein n=1 Tax=Adineta ricciae TaxID=249248 RepID=A0A815TRA5_ADIRI|nr:unnamed protein product [Adineta ricciae]
MSIIKSSKNQDKLLLDGFSYRRSNNSQSIWRCCKNKCAGRVRFEGGKYTETTAHVHAPNLEENISLEFKSNITDRATASHDPPRRIIHQALLKINKTNGAAVPSYTSSQRTIERKQKRQDLPLPTPISFSDICIPDELRITNNGDRFLLYDNGDANHRVIILSSDNDLDCLSNSEHWHCDGTFKIRLMIIIHIEICPKIFNQLYTIHGCLLGRGLPLVYCSIYAQSEAVYGEIFEVILKHLSQRPKSITIDFEKAVENVIKQQLPMTTVNYCFFHMKQALWKRITGLDLQQLFLDDAEVRDSLKNFACLTLVPEASVIVEFERVQAVAPESINEFIDYFEDNYIGRLIHNQLPRTINSSEGWHRAIQHSARSHPTIYESIKDLQVEQLQAGRVKPRRRAKYERLDKQLQQLVSSFHVTKRELYSKRARVLFRF